MKNRKYLMMTIIKSALAAFVLVPILYIVGFLLIPGKLTIGWNGSNWCNTNEFGGKQIQQYLLFEGFWMGVFLSFFAVCVFLLSYKFGKKLEKRWRLAIALVFSILFLLAGCIIANKENISLINTVNDPNSCRD